jgi:hypothetical protein
MFFKPKLKFYSEIPSVNEQYPIIDAKKYKRSWVKNCAGAYKKYEKIIDKRSSNITAAKCPGMRNIMEAGYIVTSWCDFTIETFEDKPFEYKVYYPNGMDRFLKEVGYNKPVVSDFNMKDGPVRIPTGNNFKGIIKIWSPWTIDIPKGWELMFLPIQYEDDPKFTACAGMISGLATDLNIHVFWHETNGRVHIPAGTPLCQLVPVKTDGIDATYEAVNSSVKHRMLRTIFNKYHRM